MSGERPKKMLIGELSKKTGVPTYTIHYYLKKGLLHQPNKVSKTRAYYDATHLDRLRTIKNIRRDFNSPLAYVKNELGEKDESAVKKPAAKPLEKNRRNSGARHEEKKNIILDEAIDLFAKQGYHRTNIKQVADHLGISTGTLYVYFKNKQDLFLQVARRMVKKTVESVAKAVAGEDDLIKVVYLRAKSFNQNYERYSDTLAQLRAESISMGDQGQEMLKDIHFALIKPLIPEIQQAIKQGIIREIDPELLALTFLALNEMMCYRLTWDEKYKLDEIYAFLFDLIMNGLRRGGSSRSEAHELAP